MLKKIYTVQNKKTNEIYRSKKGVKYYDKKCNAKTFRESLIENGENADNLSIVGYMLIIVEIDDEGVEV